MYLEIKRINEYRYMLDGGTILLFIEDRRDHVYSLEMVQETAPIENRDGTENGDIFVDDRKITSNVLELREIKNRLVDFLEFDERQEEAKELPPNTLVFGDDLNRLYTADNVGRERQVLKWVIDRLNKAIH